MNHDKDTMTHARARPRNHTTHHGRRRGALLSLLIVSVVAVSTSASGLATSDDADQWGDDIEPSRVIIHFHDGVPDELPLYIDDLGGEVVTAEDGSPFIVVSIDPADSLDLIEVAQADDRVFDATHDRYVYPMYTPNDMLLDYWPQAVGLDDAWDVTLGSHAVDLHILDTGIDHTHLDLLPNLSPQCKSPLHLGWSFVGASAPGGQESGFHGTHVAGIAGAVINNTIGVAGASQSCITSVRVLAAESGLQSWVANGIIWSANTGADIISMSLGGSSGTASLEWAVDYAHSKGALVVAAAGNDDCGPVSYPAAYDNAMAVAALDWSGTIWASYSNCGPEVDISAPGDIWSTLPGNTYGPLSGTSMATPVISGIAGLVLAENGTLSNDQLRCILEKTADDMGPSGHDNKFGWGIVDAEEAVDAASNPASVGC